MKISERLMWTFAILFVLCGAVLWFVGTEDREARDARIAGGAAMACLGSFALCLAWNALETGEIKIQHLNYTRAHQPRRFFAVLSMILTAGGGVLGAALWFLFV